MSTILCIALAASAAGIATEGRLSGTAIREERIELRTGDLLTGAVEQDGIDLVVRVKGPGGATLLEVDRPNGTQGPEPILLVAPTAGTYFVEVQALDPAGPEGAYRVRVEAPRPATERDRDLARARGLWATAWQERTIGLAGAPGARAHYEKARAAGESALVGWRKLLGPRDPSVAEALDLLGYVYDEIGEYARGRDAFAEALAIREAAEPGSARTLGTRSDLGYLYLAAGDPAKAQQMFESVLATDPRRSAARRGLARALQDRGDLAKAREVAAALVAEHRATPGGSASTSEIVRLAEIDLALGHAQEARAELREVEGRLPVPPAPYTNGHASLLEALAETDLALGDVEAASRRITAARAVREAALGADHPALAHTRAIETKVREARGEAIEVAPGVHVLRGRFVLTEQPDGNTTILRAPEGLVVVDTGRHAAHTQRIVDFASAAGQPVAAVVNTHWHLDHIGGDVMLRRFFPGLKVYASTAIVGARTGFLARYHQQLEDALAKAAGDPEKEKPLRAELALIDAGPALVPDQPVTRSGPVTIAGRKLELGLQPPAVTAADVWVFDPATKVLVSGDLVTLPAPLFDTACPAGWKDALDALADVPFERLVPGHGPVLTRDQFETYRRAFGNLLACAASPKSKGECIDGWLADAGALVPAEEQKMARALLDYYLDTSLRPPDPARTADLCRVPDPSAP
jgi:glyoxylase-like metal-dependent hydrolase (beta-lactamase superfamily II)/tetratricopeptide (TPR) repeat protein